MWDFTGACGCLIKWGDKVMVVDLSCVEIIHADDLGEYAKSAGCNPDDFDILWQGKSQDLPEEYHQYA